MKISPRETSAVLAVPQNWQGMLFYGDDLGLITERAREIAQKVSEKDSFRLTALLMEEIERLPEEYSALSFFGGRRAVLLREVTDAALPLVKQVLDSPQADAKEAPLIVMEGGGLSAKSKLRKYAETSQKIAAIGCYPPTGAEISDWVRRELASHKILLSNDADLWLSTHMEGDRALLRSEVEKFCLYAEPGTRLEREDLEKITGDTASADMGEAIQWGLAGRYEKADAAFRRALAEGQHPVAYARGVLYQLRRLEKVKAEIEKGIAPAQAVANLRPPVFWRDRDNFMMAVKRWSKEGLGKIGTTALELEKACKQNGPPAELLAWRHLAWLCKKQR